MQTATPALSVPAAILIASGQTPPRYEVRAYADHDCEQQVAAEWADTLIEARSALDEAFVMGMTVFGCIIDHKHGFVCQRRAVGLA